MSAVLTDLYRQKHMSGEIESDKAQAEAVQALERLRMDLTTHELKPGWKRFFKRADMIKGVYLWGDVGRGKTMLMDMFFETLPPDLPKRRVHFHEFMQGVHDYLHTSRKNKDTGTALLNHAKEVAQDTKVLCFDEFHVTDIADAMLLGRLFEALFKHGVAVVATSNWLPDRLYEGGLQRERFLPFIDILKNHMQVVEVGGAIDYRLQCLTDTGVYFQPLGKGAQASADDVFKRLTDGVKTYAEDLSVKGRKIKVETVAKGVARFSFAQLCERPLGARDYLLIAKTYHTIFVEGVPKMGYDRRNEAKRFMTLVDALYDNGTKLIVVADTKPEKLYGGHDHAFEFQRTVSRLIEMQSREYLQG